MGGGACSKCHRQRARRPWLSPWLSRRPSPPRVRRPACRRCSRQGSPAGGERSRASTGWAGLARMHPHRQRLSSSGAVLRWTSIAVWSSSGAALRWPSMTVSYHPPKRRVARIFGVLDLEAIGSRAYQQRVLDSQRGTRPASDGTVSAGPDKHRTAQPARGQTRIIGTVSAGQTRIIGTVSTRGRRINWLGALRSPNGTCRSRALDAPSR